MFGIKRTKEQKFARKMNYFVTDMMIRIKEMEKCEFPYPSIYTNLRLCRDLLQSQMHPRDKGDPAFWTL